MAKRFPCQRANDFDPYKVTNYPVAVEPKVDGFRAFVVVKPNPAPKKGWQVSVRSRTNKEYVSVQHIGDAVKRAFIKAGYETAVVFDGEMFCGDYRTTSSELRLKSSKSYSAEFVMYDILPLDEFEKGESALTFEERRAILYKFFRDGKPDKKLVRMSQAVLAENRDAIDMLYSRAKRLGYEGAVVKSLTGLWRDKQTYDWMRMKTRKSVDLEIIKALQGEGRYTGTTGNIIVRYKGRDMAVESGYTDAERDMIWKLDQEGKLEGRIVEIAYFEIGTNGILRHASFKGFRDDKTEADV